MSLQVPDIHAILKRRGDAPYGAEAVTQLEHALQCAQLAESDAAKVPGAPTASLEHFIRRAVRIAFA